MGDEEPVVPSAPPAPPEPSAPPAPTPDAGEKKPSDQKKSDVSTVEQPGNIPSQPTQKPKDATPNESKKKDDPNGGLDLDAKAQREPHESDSESNPNSLYEAMLQVFLHNPPRIMGAAAAYLIHLTLGYEKKDLPLGDRKLSIPVPTVLQAIVLPSLVAAIGAVPQAIVSVASRFGSDVKMPEAYYNIFKNAQQKLSIVEFAKVTVDDENALPGSREFAKKIVDFFGSSSPRIAADDSGSESDVPNPSLVSGDASTQSVDYSAAPTETTTTFPTLDEAGGIAAGDMETPGSPPSSAPGPSQALHNLRYQDPASKPNQGPASNPTVSADPTTPIRPDSSMGSASNRPN